MFCAATAGCAKYGCRKSAYRQPVTPQGLKAIEKGTLTWLDDDMYNNLNTGVLEQYLEEKNLDESFEVSHWSTPKVMYGIAIGAIFSGVTAYIGLKPWTCDFCCLVHCLFTGYGTQMVAFRSEHCYICHNRGYPCID